MSTALALFLMAMALTALVGGIASAIVWSLYSLGELAVKAWRKK